MLWRLRLCKLVDVFIVGIANWCTLSMHFFFFAGFRELNMFLFILLKSITPKSLVNELCGCTGTEKMNSKQGGWTAAVLRSLPPVEEVLNSVLHGLGFMHHRHRFVLQCSVSHTVVNVFVLLEHPQLHLRLHAHSLRDIRRVASALTCFTFIWWYTMTTSQWHPCFPPLHLFVSKLLPALDA